MKKLSKKDTWRLWDRWIFMDIVHFMIDVDNECIMDCDGYGEYVYTDENCQLYTNEDYVNFCELRKYGFFGLDEFIGSKSNNKYRLIGVFWYNK